MLKKKSNLFILLALLALLMALSACGSSEEEATAEPAVEEAVEEEAVEEEAEVGTGLAMEAAEVASEFFSQEQYDRAMRQMTMEPVGPADQPWIQIVDDQEFADTSEWAKEGPYTFCFSNAGVNNPWRVVGWTTMQAEVDLHSEIEEFIHVDAEGSDEKQIADIADLVAGGNCDVLIISPNTTAALTPAVEQACEELPVIVFDRGVFTDCPVSFVQPIGGYAYGETGARYVIDNCGDDCNVLAIRILPGVDVLEERWAAAKLAFEASDNINVIGVEFGDGDNAKVKSLVIDYLDRFGRIDAVWMDAGASAVAALEGFEDAGEDFPIIVGEDQQDFLKKWQDNDLSGISPTFPTFQWRTPVIAGLNIMNGEEVPSVWRLPQPTIDNDNLDTYVFPNMPPLHYAMCGCEEMPEFPARWGGE